jgi:Mn-dependent DtxR family transcriptional regulator
MDHSEYPSLPNLAQIHARLVVNNLRVLDVVDGKLFNIERLLAAILAHDWPLVEKVSRYLAEHVTDRGLQQIASKVCDELKRNPSGHHAPNSLAQLLDQCRTYQQQPKS